MGEKTRPIRLSNEALNLISLDPGEQQILEDFDLGQIRIIRGDDRESKNRDRIEFILRFDSKLQIGKWKVVVLEAGTKRYLTKRFLRKDSRRENAYSAIVRNLPQDRSLTLRLST